MSQLGQRSRSSRWRHDHPGRTGEPFTGRRTSGLTGVNETQKQIALGGQESNDEKCS